MMRPDKDNYYLDIALAVSKRSICLRKKFGAVIVVGDTIVSTGYNGPARGVVHCNKVGCLKDERDVPTYTGYEFCPAVHAEENAIINAARSGVSVVNGVVYVLCESRKGHSSESRPCDRCRRVMINAGITRVVTRSGKKIISYNVKDWVKQDTEEYLKALKDAKKDIKKKDK
jgi:dCMP deaminase